jgi:hypothetical protein
MKRNPLLYVKILAGYALLLMFSSVYAAPQEFLYRLDTRAPAQIFEEGLTSWGSVFDIDKHLGEANYYQSAYISSSNSFEWARKLQNEHHNEGEKFYLYKVKVPPNTFDTRPTLKATRTPQGYRRYYQGFNADETELLTVKAIPRGYIREVGELDNATGFFRWRPKNPNYRGNSLPTWRASSEVMPNRGNQETVIRQRLEATTSTARSGGRCSIL